MPKRKPSLPSTPSCLKPIGTQANTLRKYIVEYEQKGEKRAEYGKQLLVNLAKDLTVKCGKGFNRTNLTYMRKLYLAFPKCGTLSHKLTWSHYYEILKCDDTLEMKFYLNEAIKEAWTVRELKRQIKSFFSSVLH